MKLLLISICILSLFANEEKYQKEDGILVLTSQNIQDAISEFPNLLVEFYAPWCQHCKKFAPQYVDTAKLLKSQQPVVTVAKIDISEEKKLAEDYEIKSYPTFKFFRNNQIKDYKGSRNPYNLANWALKKAGAPSVLVKSIEDAKNIIGAYDVVTGLFLDGNNNEEILQLYQQVGEEFDNIFFFHSTDAEIRNEFQLQPGQYIVIFKNFDEPRNTFTQELNQDNLNKFLTVYSLPLVMQFDLRVIDMIFNRKKSGIVLFSDDLQGEVYKQFQKIAYDYRGQLQFLSTHTKDSAAFNKVSEYFGVSALELPMIIIIHPEDNNNKYKYQGDFSEQDIRQFIQNFYQGKLVKYLKSQEIPEINEEPVKIVVGKTFEDLVINNNKDVLVEFYAPWCPHCKKFSPIYDRFATKLEKNENIVIAKIDAANNEVQNLTISSYPTLMFYKNGDKLKPILYEGDKTEEKLLEFLQKYTSYPWLEIGKQSDL